MMTSANTRRLNTEARRLRRALERARNANEVRQMERSVKADRRLIEGATS